ncbi:hypothetical protein [Streptomyces europaeiscabiei]|uniref:Uncharacterized protein n=1 Tax=Streptomyces europaeiscabiei TaxID=146819 RepID=A0ABU4NKQ0_9ACTN|nr:hypothetical protein [Streptomyces europaeiscabiei]MDX3545646.1 hypothetical protein [Streptomyces europaeiscabiei]MDX3554956.1 hypothetical protein [Streptomyces europaeiscabiei]MDX3702777.1 hypothetical protein [Streptomyces europaeiscabiei]MDX3865082.1 hypothetical protein [Streptomyces europaeiscabiei]MDX3872547.1 hypothetical protein [Streptomyces europaeiscabiei]
MRSMETPSDGHAEVRVVAASPEVARRVAEVLRRCFDATEQRSYPAGPDGGTRLDLTVDTTRPAEPARSWLEASRSAENGRSAEATAGPAEATAAAESETASTNGTPGPFGE